MGCDFNDSLVSRALALLFWSFSFVFPRSHADGSPHHSFYSQASWHVHSSQIHVWVRREFAEDFLWSFNDFLQLPPLQDLSHSLVGCMREATYYCWARGRSVEVQIPHLVTTNNMPADEGRPAMACLVPPSRIWNSRFPTQHCPRPLAICILSHMLNSLKQYLFIIS